VPRGRARPVGDHRLDHRPDVGPGERLFDGPACEGQGPDSVLDQRKLPDPFHIERRADINADADLQRELVGQEGLDSAELYRLLLQHPHPRFAYMSSTADHYPLPQLVVRHQQLGQHRRVDRILPDQGDPVPEPRGLPPLLVERQGRRSEVLRAAPLVDDKGWRFIILCMTARFDDASVYSLTHSLPSHYCVIFVLFIYFQYAQCRMRLLIMPCASSKSFRCI
jgi:hypothetical protein